MARDRSVDGRSRHPFAALWFAVAAVAIVGGVAAVVGHEATGRMLVLSSMGLGLATVLLLALWETGVIGSGPRGR